MMFYDASFLSGGTTTAVAVEQQARARRGARRRVGRADERLPRVARRRSGRAAAAADVREAAALSAHTACGTS